jgi:prepilin-type N-terminal cleavage/methylation domain-containing protein
MKKIASKKGFTLIELLVVISIIAILMAVMMPALAKARELAKNVICKSNMKNLGLAAILWSEDNDGWSLPGLWDRGNKEGDSLLIPYLGDEQSGSGVGLCPAVPAKYAGKTYEEIGYKLQDLSGSSANLGNYYSSYGYNQTLFNKTGKPLGTFDSANDDDTQWGKGGVWYKKHGNTKVNTIRKPAEKIMFSESYLYLSSYWVFNKGIQTPAFKDQASRGRRHFPKKRRVGGSDSELCGRMNITWLDGTVSEEPEDLEDYTESSNSYRIKAEFWVGD